MEFPIYLLFPKSDFFSHKTSVKQMELAYKKQLISIQF